MTRLEFLYTGGTIGMIGSPRGLDTGADVRGAVAGLLRDRAVSFDFAEFPRLIDSANATPADWQRMVDHLRARRAGFDGFIVLHGTNTLAHSAAAVSYALTGFGKPVVFTGSQIPFGLPDTDAPGNVLGAVEAVLSGGVTSVAVFFDGLLLRGTRATKVSSLTARGFASPHPVPAGAELGAGWPDPLPYRAHDIAVVTAVPGLTAARFRAMTTPRPDAVLFRVYGAGEGPGDEPGLPGAIAELVAAGTPVVVLSQVPHARVDLDKSAASEFLRQAGAVGAADLTFEAAYTKLMFLLSQGITGRQLEKWLLADIAGELTQVG